jgi:hypothetical protein
MRMKINKNYIELFCTLKNDVHTFQPKKKSLFKYLNNMISNSSTLCLN